MSLAFRIAKESLAELEPGHFYTDSASVRLSPGQFPMTVEVFPGIGNQSVFRKDSSTPESYQYQQLGGTTILTILI